MNHIKINRAMRKSALGRFPASAQAMLDAIPQSVVTALTSAQLAEMLDHMWSACQASKALAQADAIRDGAVWDARQRRLRDIAA